MCAGPNRSLYDGGLDNERGSASELVLGDGRSTVARKLGLETGLRLMRKASGGSGRKVRDSMFPSFNNMYCYTAFSRWERSSDEKGGGNQEKET